MSADPVVSSIQHLERQIDDTGPPSPPADMVNTRGTARAVPYHCPFCAGEDLRPDEAGRSAWRCGGCLRIFSVTFLGLTGQAAASRARQES